MKPIRSSTVSAIALLTLLAPLGAVVGTAAADSLVCRKVVAEAATGEGRNSAAASRVKCAPGEMLTGGTCYAEVRPEEDGTCQTSAMGIIQPLAEHPGTTEEAFFSCLQTGGTDCPVQARTRAMAICCKTEPSAPAAAPSKKP